MPPQLEAGLRRAQPHVPTRSQRLARPAAPLQVEAAAEIDRAGRIQFGHGFPQPFGQGLDQLAVGAERIGRQVGEVHVPPPVGPEIAVAFRRDLDRPVLGLAVLEGDVPIAVDEDALELVEAIGEVNGLDRRAFALRFGPHAHAELLLAPAGSEPRPSGRSTPRGRRSCQTC